MKKNKKLQSGFILFFTLIMLVLVSFMLIYTLHAVEFQKEMNHYKMQHLSLHEAAKKELKTIFENFNQAKSVCRLPLISDTVLIGKSLGWWRKRCHTSFNNIQLNYFVSHIQETPCIFLHKKPVTFWQISVRASSGSQASQVIQASIAVPTSSMVECEGKKQWLKTQWQSKRIL